MKIVRHRRGDTRSITNPHAAYVVLMDMGYCARLYFLFFRGYESNGDVLYKRIASDKEITKERLEDL